MSMCGAIFVKTTTQVKAPRPEKGQFKTPKKVYAKPKPGDKRIGNKFWLFRTKHGRDANFESPEQLWASACEYFEWAAKRSWYIKEAIKSGDMAGQTMNVPVTPPFTMDALWIGIGSSRKHWSQFKDSKAFVALDFSDVYTRIESIVYTQKYEGAAIGAYNANIIARDLGLADKSEITGKDGTPLITPKSDEELEHELRILQTIVNGVNGHGK